MNNSCFDERLINESNAVLGSILTSVYLIIFSDGTICNAAGGAVAS